MPYSYGLFKDVVIQHLKENIEQSAKILDVGAGCGTYGKLLHEFYPKIHAIEIYPKYLEMFKFEVWYEQVFVKDIRDFDYMNYDYLIMGDVVEHLPVSDAQKIITSLTKAGKKCMVSVPYLFKQGVEYDNIHEVHIQEDLTPILTIQRYPELKLLCGDSSYGYYINYDVPNSNQQ